MKVSFVISNRNGAKLLPGLLGSIFAQNYQQGDIEVIVVDDCSDDNSIEVICDYPKAIKLVENRKVLGPAYSKNIGADLSTHDLLFFLDNDAFLFEDSLAILVQRLNDSSVASVQPKIFFADQTNTINSAGGVANIYGYAWDRGIYEPDEGQYDQEVIVLFATSAAMLIKKDMFYAAGMFDVSYFYLNEDYDLGLRLSLIKGDTLYVPEAKCYHYQSYTMGRGNLCVNYLMERNRLATILKNYEFLTLLQLLPDLLRVKFKKVNEYRSNKRNYVQLFSLFSKMIVWFVFNSFRLLKNRISVQKMRLITDKLLFDKMNKYAKLFPTINRS